MKQIIKDALERKGMSQKELADAVHVTPQAVSKWITGESRPTQDNVVAIYETLGIDLTREMVKASQKERKTMYKTQTEIKDLDTIEKVKKETEFILNRAGIPQNYQHPIYKLLDWLVSATIGMLYYKGRLAQAKNKETEYDYDSIRYELESFFEPEIHFKGYPNRLAYTFYIFGMDLFEAGAEYEMDRQTIDYGNEAMSFWYNVEKAFAPNWRGSLIDEFKAALLEVIESLE